MKPNKKITLTEAISYDEEIKGHPIVQIFSGVGSGKNYFAERFIEGDEQHGIPKKTVLIITSRRAKVDEVIAEGKVDIKKSISKKWDMFYHLYEDDEPYDEDKVRTIIDFWGTHKVYQESVICTNAFIEQYLRYIYSPDYAVTHLWELFDVIIIDEVHSVITDATYQSAPFYIHELVNEFIKRHKLADENPLTGRRPLCEQIIMMTGTQDPLNCLKLSEEYSTVIDKMNICKRVQPKNVRFITLKDAKVQIADQLAAGERIIYFQNHTDLPTEFCKGTSIDPTVVVPSFSKDEKRRLMKKENRDLHNRMEALEKSLREDSLVPHDVKLFLTTSRNKEGINIEDKDIKIMYVESHILSDIEQMTGRVREGVDDLYIIVDSIGYKDNEHWFESDYERKEIAGSDGAANRYFKFLCNKKGNRSDLYRNRESSTNIQCHKELVNYMNMIHGKYSNIKYSYFDNEFKHYFIRKLARDYQRKSLVLFNIILANPKACLRALKKRFPDSEIHPYYSVDMKAMNIFNKYIPDVDSKTYDNSVIEALKKELQKECYPELNKLNYMLARFCDFEWKRVSNTKGNKGYNKIRFVRRAELVA